MISTKDIFLMVGLLAVLAVSLFAYTFITQGETPFPTPTPFATGTPQATATASPGTSATPQGTAAPYFTPAATSTPTPPLAAEVISLEISTDRETYAPMEKMTITVLVVASGRIPDATIKLTGVTNSRGFSYLNHEISTTLPQGESEHVYYLTLPSCSTCSGLSFGQYSVAASVLVNGVVVKQDTKFIQIQPAQ